jgi:hypothetical protein
MTFSSKKLICLARKSIHQQIKCSPSDLTRYITLFLLVLTVSPANIFID